MIIITKKDILHYYQNRQLDDGEKEYLVYNGDRIPRILNVIERLLPEILNKGKKEVRILDVGPHFLTEQIHRFFPDVVINTLGFENQRLYDPKIINKHLQYDLNDAQNPEKWISFDQHDIIIISEVMEHLYTSPIRVLSFLKTLMLPGAFILITVPNALAITHRLKLLFGKHPYEMIRESRENPGHFREYTRLELMDIGKKAGLKFESSWSENYARSKNKLINFIILISSIFPGFRQGLFIIFKNE